MGTIQVIDSLFITILLNYSKVLAVHFFNLSKVLKFYNYTDWKSDLNIDAKYIFFCRFFLKYLSLKLKVYKSNGKTCVTYLRSCSYGKERLQIAIVPFAFMFKNSDRVVPCREDTYLSWSTYAGWENVV